MQGPLGMQARDRPNVRRKMGQRPCGALEMVARGRAEPADYGVKGSGTCCDCFSGLEAQDTPWSVTKGAVACETGRGNNYG